MSAMFGIPINSEKKSAVDNNKNRYNAGEKIRLPAMVSGLKPNPQQESMMNEKNDIIKCTYDQ